MKTICRRFVRQPSLLLVTCALSWSLPASAQTTVDGTAEWTFNSSATQNNDQRNDNSAFLQNYALGLSSTLFDPRILKYNTEGIFRTSRLTSGGTLQPEGQGRQGDVGYKLGASLLPASSLPFFVQASRTISNSQGDLGPTNPVRAGMIAPTGAPPVDFESLNKTLNLGWQLNLGALPRVELGYREGSSLVTGGGYQAQQSDRDLSARVTKDTARTRQALRYQQTDFETQLAQTFSQRLNNLDYDLGADLTSSLHIIGHTGRRSTYSRSQFAPTLADAGGGVYQPPPTLGLANADYALAGVNFEPTPRFGLRFDGSLDRQASSEATTTARLATMSTHVEVFKGLRLTGSGVSGVRGQLVSNTPTDVTTRSAVGGASYQLTLGWFSTTVGATRGTGRNSTRDGRLGRLESWSREASVSTSFPWIALGAGYEKAENRDDILDFGNYNSERLRASAQTGSRRLSLTANADQARIERGVADTYALNYQRTVSGTASLRIRHDGFISATGGAFQNDYTLVTGSGRDQTLFWGVTARAAVRALIMTAAVRSENAVASQTGFDQQAINGTARLEYRIRLLNVALEYREGNSRLLYAAMPSPDAMRGRQLRVSIIRQFGFRR